MLELDELIERIKDGKYNEEDLCDLLHITVDDILETFKHRIDVYRDNFADLEYYEYEPDEDGYEDSEY